MKTMTSRERLLAAIDGREVDRIPVSPRIWRYGLWKKSSKIALAREFDFDLFEFGVGGLSTPLNDPLCQIVKPMLPDVRIEIRTDRTDQKVTADRTFHTPGGVLHDVIVIPDAGGEYGIGPNPLWLEPLVKTAEDVERLPYILPAPEYVKDNFDSTRELEKQIGDNGLVAFRSGTGVDQIAVDALGVAQAMMVSVEAPQMLKRLLDLVDDWYTNIMKLALEEGHKIIFDAWFNFSLSTGWSPDFYREEIIPRIKSHTDLVHSYHGKMFFYDDGKVSQNIGDIIDTGVDIIQTLTPPPAGDLDFRWLAENHGGRTCFNGGVDTVQLRFGTPEEVDSDVREVMETLTPTGKFILGTTDSITEGTPLENMHAFFNAARKYGKIAARKL
ncbi:MAG: hypothetical protein K8S55_05865 [Phycisphaerae bacterium]|nr:hypothetical protein [Phycisphaerae bacterium]